MSTGSQCSATSTWPEEQTELDAAGEQRGMCSYPVYDLDSEEIVNNQRCLAK